MQGLCKVFHEHVSRLFILILFFFLTLLLLVAYLRFDSHIREDAIVYVFFAIGEKRYRGKKKRAERVPCKHTFSLFASYIPPCGIPFVEKWRKSVHPCILHICSSSFSLLFSLPFVRVFWL